MKYILIWLCVVFFSLAWAFDVGEARKEGYESGYEDGYKEGSTDDQEIWGGMSWAFDGCVFTGSFEDIRNEKDIEDFRKWVEYEYSIFKKEKK